PVLQPMMHMPLPSDEVYASLKDLLVDLDGMRKVLTDPEITTVRIVLNLEKMVVKEAKRAYTYLSLFGYVTDAVIVNRQLPRDLASTRAGAARHRRRLDRGWRAAGSVRAAARGGEGDQEMSGDRERVIELVNELGSRVGHVLAEMVPPAAQVHLLNAQRELITALMLIYENRVAPAPSATRARRARARRRTNPRDRKIPIE